MITNKQNWHNTERFLQTENPSDGETYVFISDGTGRFVRSTIILT